MWVPAVAVHDMPPTWKLPVGIGPPLCDMTVAPSIMSASVKVPASPTPMLFTVNWNAILSPTTGLAGTKGGTLFVVVRAAPELALAYWGTNPAKNNMVAKSIEQKKRCF